MIIDCTIIQQQLNTKSPLIDASFSNNAFQQKLNQWEKDDSKVEMDLASFMNSLLKDPSKVCQNSVELNCKHKA